MAKIVGEIALQIVGAVLLLVAGMAHSQDRSPVVTYTRLTPATYEVKVFADQSIIYNGVSHVRTLGVRSRKLTSEQYANLLKAFEDAKFSEMDEVYGTPLVSTTSLTITSTLHGVHKQVSASGARIGWPKRLYSLMWSIEDLPQVRELTCPIQARTGANKYEDLCKSVRDGEEASFKGAK